MKNSNSKTILIVDDEDSIRRFLHNSLKANGFEILEASNGKAGAQTVLDRKPDLVLLDYGLPDISGLDVLKKIRSWSKVPVIFLTVQDHDEDKVAALDNGADDYLTKPFSIDELLARIRVALRHASPEEDAQPVFKTGLLEIDRSAHVVRVKKKEIKLTSTEYDLLALLAKNAGKWIPHRNILKEIWGPNSVEHDHYLRVYFSQIRKKLEAAAKGSGNLIENDSGVGYRIVVE